MIYLKYLELKNIFISEPSMEKLSSELNRLSFNKTYIKVGTGLVDNEDNKIKMTTYYFNRLLNTKFLVKQKDGCSYRLNPILNKNISENIMKSFYNIGQFEFLGDTYEPTNHIPYEFKGEFLDLSCDEFITFILNNGYPLNDFYYNVTKGFYIGLFDYTKIPVF